MDHSAIGELMGRLDEVRMTRQTTGLEVAILVRMAVISCRQKRKTEDGKYVRVLLVQSMFWTSRNRKKEKKKEPKH